MDTKIVAPAILTYHVMPIVCHAMLTCFYCLLFVVLFKLPETKSSFCACRHTSSIRTSYVFGRLGSIVLYGLALVPNAIFIMKNVLNCKLVWKYIISCIYLKVSIFQLDYWLNLCNLLNTSNDFLDGAIDDILPYRSKCSIQRYTRSYSILTINLQWNPQSYTTEYGVLFFLIASFWWL